MPGSAVYYITVSYKNVHVCDIHLNVASSCVTTLGFRLRPQQSQSGELNQRVRLSKVQCTVKQSVSCSWKTVRLTHSNIATQPQPLQIRKTQVKFIMNDLSFCHPPGGGRDPCLYARELDLSQRTATKFGCSWQ